MNTTYYVPTGGHPTRELTATSRAVFTPAYAFIPRDTMQDIVASYLPHWSNTRTWVLARPMSGFAETFSHYIVEVSAEGGSEHPEPDDRAEAVLFVVGGTGIIEIGDQTHDIEAGSYVYLPPSFDWSLRSAGPNALTFHWLRKTYQRVDGIDAPEAFVTREADQTPIPMPVEGQSWTTTRFVDPADLRHDMHVNVVTFKPGAIIPFMETHVMEHGLYVLQGKGRYRLNRDWVDVEAGDYMWLRAFCPQACEAQGDEPFRYLLYKDVNRHMPLTPLAT
ncbi:MAG: bifunctional allantoicase/(S)-ureidoglycine aminohydrolase [Boseongicola sp.]|nr:bifunctional allantoicase/(S)-ureidoglycine aminohydrolase [Boseongicola sp.]